MDFPIGVPGSATLRPVPCGYPPSRRRRSLANNHRCGRRLDQLREPGVETFPFGSGSNRCRAMKIRTEAEIQLPGEWALGFLVPSFANAEVVVQHRIRINDQDRVCSTWTAMGPEDVEIVDCHDWTRGNSRWCASQNTDPLPSLPPPNRLPPITRHQLSARAAEDGMPLSTEPQGPAALVNEAVVVAAQ